MTQVRTTLDRVVGVGKDLVAQMTAGQRWTASLALVGASLMVAFGLPVTVAVRETPHRETRPVTGPADGARDAGVAETASRPEPFSASPHGDIVVAVPRSPTSPSSPAPAGAGSGARRLAVVALVDDDPTGSGRREGAVATAFLRRAGLDVTVVAEDLAAAGACDAAVRAGSIVVSARGLPRALRTCLLDRGATLLSHDDLGGGPGAVSTAPGVRASLVEGARWLTDDRSAGRVVVAVDEALRPEVDAVLPVMRNVGLNVVTVVSVGESPDVSVASGVLEASRAGANTVLFAAGVARQREWVAQAAPLAAGIRYVVLDARDAVADERYPPGFDGALARTVMRAPWYEREYGPTGMQRACRSVVPRPDPILDVVDGGDAFRTYAWCQHAALLSVAADHAASGLYPALLDALSRAPIDSPLTSPLRPRDNGEIGPSEAAVLEWRVACSCWRERDGFRPR